MAMSNKVIQCVEDNRKREADERQAAAIEREEQRRVQKEKRDRLAEQRENLRKQKHYPTSIHVIAGNQLVSPTLAPGRDQASSSSSSSPVASTAVSAAGGAVVPTGLSREELFQRY